MWQIIFKKNTIPKSFGVTKHTVVLKPCFRSNELSVVGQEQSRGTESLYFADAESCCPEVGVRPDPGHPNSRARGRWKSFEMATVFFNTPAQFRHKGGVFRPRGLVTGVTFPAATHHRLGRISFLFLTGSHLTQRPHQHGRPNSPTTNRNEPKGNKTKAKAMLPNSDCAALAAPSLAWAHPSGRERVLTRVRAGSAPGGGRRPRARGREARRKLCPRVRVPRADLSRDPRRRPPTARRPPSRAALRLGRPPQDTLAARVTRGRPPQAPGQRLPGALPQDQRRGRRHPPRSLARRSPAAARGPANGGARTGTRKGQAAPPPRLRAPAPRPRPVLQS